MQITNSSISQVANPGPPPAKAGLRSWFTLFVSVLLLIGGLAVDSRADEPSIQDLQKRIEEVEKQNQVLQDALRNKIDGLGSKSRGAIVQASAEEEDESGEADEHIRSVVRDYLAKDSKEKSAAETNWVEVGSDVSMKANWKNGVEIETTNKDFRMKVRGRTQFDMASFDVPANVATDPSLVNPIRNGVDFRRLRIGVEGTIYEQIDYVMEYDFINSALAVPSAVKPVTTIAVPAPTDLYWTFMKLPAVGNIRIGNQKEPIGMEHNTSSRYLPFMERSYNQDAFYGGFNNGFVPGINFFDTAFDERMTWAIGAFKPTFNVFAFDLSDGNYSFTGRLTGLPWYVDEGNGLLHLGVSARQAGMDNGIWRYRTRASERAGLSQNWPLIADTDNITGVNQQWYNAEASMQLGSLMMVAEYLVDFVHDAARGNKPTVGTIMYQGGYVEVLYFLTGEKRDYNKKMGVWDRVIPAENAFCLSDENKNWLFGRGAWQIASRFNYLDLNDKGIDGGRLKDVTLGLNWFLNPHMKVQWNYSITDRQSINVANSGIFQGFGMRVAHDF
ncbi:MAG: hypothetical protein JSS02_34700 [Planctomycetes bacterium]|nr:hypothetical protein [Planctomycetota bacterium]